MINFKCSCGKELKVPDSLARKVVTCNQCGRKNIQLPGAGERLDLSDYELEDIDPGTIILEAPSSQGSLVPRKPIKKQPKAVSESRPRRLPRRDEKPEPEPEPEPDEEFENEPARPARHTRRLQEKKQEAPVRKEKPSRRGSSRKKVSVEVEPEAKSLKAHSSQLKLQVISKLVEELKSEDEQETVGEVQAARKGRSGRGSEGKGSKGKKSRESDEDDFRDYGNSQKFLYVIIGAIVLVAIALFFYFKEPSTKKPTPVVAQPIIDTTKPPEKTAPKVEPPKYEKITEEGNNLLALYNITGENKEAIIVALEEKRKAAVARKLSSKSYDSYIQEILNKKLAYVFAIHHIVETTKLENEEHKHVLFTLASLINSASNINEDKDLMKGFPVEFNAARISVDKDKLIEFLEKTKKDFNDDFAKKEIIKTPIDWKLVVDIVVNGKVEDDTTDIQIQPQ